MEKKGIGILISEKIVLILYFFLISLWLKIQYPPKIVFKPHFDVFMFQSFEKLKSSNENKINCFSL